ncbi:hypothetical protein AACH06_04835 [Ideonella sp. DXS29W]|uniref:DUF721 domain-containing protein n=1 Tax=Ideonella lacteola TaxID=2984193 RepID=A0ABU9BND2_9BURK
MTYPPPSQAGGPHTRPITEALDANATLANLLQRLKEAEARLVTVREALPPGLRAHVRSGALDETGWNLLVPNGAVAAKLRQCLPAIEQALLVRGWKPTSLRVKVQSERS